jgi:hypothetical protein
LTQAQSSGGKSGLPAASAAVADVEHTGGPALPPALDLAGGQSDETGGLVVSDRGVFVNHPDEVEPLSIADGDGAASDGGVGLLHKIVREGTTRGLRTSHRRPSVFGKDSPPFSEATPKPRHHL